MKSIVELTVTEALRQLKAKQISAVELTEESLSAIEKSNGKLNSFLTVEKDLALMMAASADAQIASGEAGPLCGIPIGIKDCFNVEDMLSRSASHILEGFHSPYEGPAIERLRAAGTVFLGKTNTDEFTCGASTENSAYGTTHNPWDLERVPGGSSGGSAVAVTAGLSLFATATDTGGSIRQPASFCGVVGLKNTYGRVPRFGVMPMASSLDTVGAISKTVEDMALILQVMAGADDRDSTTPEVAVPDYSQNLKAPVRGLKIGIPKEYFIEGIEAGVEKAVRQAVEELQNQGAEIVEISLPHTKYAIPVYYLVAPSEISSNMARFDGIRYGPSSDTAEDLLDYYLETRGTGFGPELKRRIMIGTHVLSSGYYDAYYLKAQKVRTLICRDFDQAFGKVDVIAAPTSPTTAFKIGEKEQDPISMYLADIFTAPINLAGIPALNVPCGFSRPEGAAVDLPVGIQFIGPRFSEDCLLQVGYAYQQATDWHLKRPVIG
ncbi:aspartyl/glutamyl-tRNA amidotransferase subunit A [Candidatus Wirthbacteria bacterium CG2_30_54_11]|uniref:Glutamyl-tRNA(Gln) amidotransferase subunit A n=1 Tax=Candidatus Wirthbacteria bacterium CG2_30_54_11 TaxID=1817892 RepID=A0A1J5J630_9BACT|nr:MAG: aspartyl/glutamyl-tRNA amidotransferase subunit A [Candidatus Wirthbacteria bacterium CG2_30_54_11]